MSTNFDFLKKVDKDSFEIIAEAEKLYQNEFFEPCMAQVRRFGERVCTEVLGNRRTSENTFDDMLATLKDKISSAQEKEFIDDLYFIKKQGNISVHSVKVKSDGMLALECLQRAFEIAINYAVYYKRANSEIMRYRYDTELLVTGKASPRMELKTKYNNLKKKTSTSVPTKSLKKQRKSSKVVTAKQNKKHIVFKVLLFLSAMISFTLILFLFLLVKLG